MYTPPRTNRSNFRLTSLCSFSTDLTLCVVATGTIRPCHHLEQALLAFFGIGELTLLSIDRHTGLICVILCYACISLPQLSLLVVTDIPSWVRLSNAAGSGAFLVGRGLGIVLLVVRCWCLLAWVVAGKGCPLAREEVVVFSSFPLET